jgi:hypothetical protein
MKKIMMLAGAVALAVAAPASATDFSSKMTQIDGKPFLDPTGKPDETQPTLGSIAINALLAAYPDEKDITPEEKVKRFVLAEKIQNHQKDAQLSADEIVLVKKLIGKGYPTIVVGEAWRMLDPSSVPAANN